MTWAGSALLAVLLSAIPASAGALSNGSFERMQGDDPVAWERFDSFGSGFLNQDTTTYRTGGASVRIGQVIGFYGLSSEKLSFYPWQKSLTVTVWVKASVAGKFGLWVAWYKKDKLVKTIRTTLSAGTYDWQQVTLTDTQPPDGAGRYQVILLSESGAGSLWVDDVSAEAEQDVRTQVLVNQVGYRSGWPKTFVVQSTAPLQAGTFKILRGDGSVARSGKTVVMAPPEGWPYYYLRGDFTGLDEDGSYKVKIPSGGFTSYVFRIAANPYEEAEDLVRQFYYYQRCGTKIAGWHNYCHLDDARLSGTHFPVIGGWHEAGDYVKTTVGEPRSFYALALLAARRTGEPTYDAILSEAKWGASFMSQFISPTTGGILSGVFPRRYYWGPPEDETDGLPDGQDDRDVFEASVGNTDNQLAATGFALLAGLLGRQDYLDKAEDLWTRIAGQVPADPLSMGRLIIMETVLFDKTGDTKYRDAAHQDIDALIGMQESDGGFVRYNLTDRGVPAAGLALWTATNPGDTYTSKVKASLKKFLKNVNSQSHNPFGIQQYDPTNFFFPYDAIGAFNVGPNSDYLSVAWAATLAAKVVGFSRGNKRIIQNHLDWVMGKNPFGVCMVEGAGEYNPQFYHHRFDTLAGHGDGAVPGAIANGLIRESIDSPAPRFDILGNMYESNEPWVLHNSFFLLLMAELY